MNRREVLNGLGIAAGGLLAEGCPIAGAEAVETKNRKPIEDLHLYFCAFHIAKNNPKFQIEANHYCSMVNEEVHQCIIFDKVGEHARILGIEYIISDRLYRGLADAEKKYYHPHTYEVLSGQLFAPDVPKEKEAKMMAGLITSWGKTWHTWPDPKTALPMGEPLLMWSITKDGQLDSALLSARDRRLGIATAKVRKRRSSLGRVPQIDPPKSIDEIGRQWTNEGADRPPPH